MLAHSSCIPVLETQQLDVDIQTDDADVESSDAQTMMTLMDNDLPLSRVLWDGTLLPVFDKCVQSRSVTSDAGVYIEDVEVYDLKQRGKWRRRKKTKDESPQRGTVFRRMEIFETSRSRELKAQRRLAAMSKDQSLEEADSKTVIGKKILDFEHWDNESKLGENENETDIVVIPNRNRSINRRDNSTSPDEPGINKHLNFGTETGTNAASSHEPITGNGRGGGALHRRACCALRRAAYARGTGRRADAGPDDSG